MTNLPNLNIRQMNSRHRRQSLCLPIKSNSAIWNSSTWFYLRRSWTLRKCSAYLTRKIRLQKTSSSFKLANATKGKSLQRLMSIDAFQFHQIRRSKLRETNFLLEIIALILILSVHRIRRMQQQKELKLTHGLLFHFLACLISTSLKWKV